MLICSPGELLQSLAQLPQQDIKGRHLDVSGGARPCRRSQGCPGEMWEAKTVSGV